MAHGYMCFVEMALSFDYRPRFVFDLVHSGGTSIYLQAFLEVVLPPNKSYNRGTSRL